MSIDITEQIARMRSEVKRAEAFLVDRRQVVRPRDLAPYEADLTLLRAILATLERVAAEERPAGSLQ